MFDGSWKPPLTPIRGRSWGTSLAGLLPWYFPFHSLSLCPAVLCPLSLLSFPSCCFVFGGVHCSVGGRFTFSLSILPPVCLSLLFAVAVPFLRVDHCEKVCLLRRNWRFGEAQTESDRIPLAIHSLFWPGCQSTDLSAKHWTSRPLATKQRAGRVADGLDPYEISTQLHKVGRDCGLASPHLYLDKSKLLVRARY